MIGHWFIEQHYKGQPGGPVFTDWELPFNLTDEQRLEVLQFYRRVIPQWDFELVYHDPKG